MKNEEKESEASSSGCDSKSPSKRRRLDNNEDNADANRWRTQQTITAFRRNNATDAPGDDAVSNFRGASTSRSETDKTKKNCNSKGEHERNKEQEYQTRPTDGHKMKKVEKEIEASSSRCGSKSPSKRRRLDSNEDNAGANRGRTQQTTVTAFRRNNGTDAPGDDAVSTFGGANTSRSGTDKTKKKCNSKGEHERTKQQEFQSTDGQKMKKGEKEKEASSSGRGSKSPSKRRRLDSNADNAGANRGGIQQTIPEMFGRCNATDAPVDDAASTSRCASTSRPETDKTKKESNSKGEHERKQQQEYQSTGNNNINNVHPEHSSEELQSTKISFSYYDKQNPTINIDIECKINRKSEKSSTEETAAGTSTTKTTPPLSLLSKRLVEKFQKSREGNACTEGSQLETNKVTSTASLSGDITSSHSPSQRFSRISPAKPAKVKRYANPLSTPPRSQKPTDSGDYSTDRGLNLSARPNVSQRLFPDEHVPSTSHQITADASNHHGSLQLVSDNSKETTRFCKDQTKPFSRRINNQKSQCGITVKEESSQSDVHSTQKVKHDNISPARQAKVKIYPRPLSSPKSQSNGNTNCKNMSQKDDGSSPQDGIIGRPTANQESSVPSSESGNTDLPEPPDSSDSLYSTPERSPHEPQEEE